MSKKYIFARYKIPKYSDLDDLKKGLEEGAKFFNKKPNDYLDHIIKGIMGDIVKSTETIVREEQRIKKAKKAMSIVISVINYDSSDEIKKISDKYYNDLLEYGILSIEGKISKI